MFRNRPGLGKLLATRPDQKMPGLNLDPQINLGPNLQTYQNTYTVGPGPIVGHNFFAIFGVGTTMLARTFQHEHIWSQTFLHKGGWPESTPNGPIQKSVEQSILHKRYVGTWVIFQQTYGPCLLRKPWGYIYIYIYIYVYTYTYIYIYIYIYHLL